MTSWADVGLAVAGAPVGAAIALLGVYITNKQNARHLQATLHAEQCRARAQHEFELRSQVQRDVLSQRLAIYEALLALVDQARRLANWGGAAELPSHLSSIGNEDLQDLQQDVARQLHKVGVLGSSDLRSSMRVFADAVESVDETTVGGAWQELHYAAGQLGGCVVECAVIDRTNGITPDGLGGR